MGLKVSAGPPLRLMVPRWVGGGAGARGGGPGQRLAVSGLRVSGTPLLRVSACPAPLAHARGLRRPLDQGRRLSSRCAGGRGVGGALRAGGLGPVGGCPGPFLFCQPPCSLPGAWGLLAGCRAIAAVTCASACVGAGAAAAADSLDGSAGGWGRCAGPVLASFGPPRR